MKFTHLDDVEDNVLVEAVEDALGHAVVVPGPMDKQEVLQVLELPRGENRGQIQISMADGNAQGAAIKNSSIHNKS